jgi:type III secretion system FlhB-like substrate exporter
MRETKLIQKLSLLQANELKDFRKFLSSPYFTTNGSLPILFDFLRPFYPKFDKESLTVEQAFAATFPNEKYNANKLNKTMSELTQLTERFFRLRITESDKKATLKTEAMAYLKRGDIKAAEKRISKFTALIDTNALSTLSSYSDAYQLLSALYFSPHTNKFKNSKLLQEAVEYLDAYYIVAALREGSEMQQISHLVRSDYDALFLPEVLDRGGHNKHLADTALLSILKGIYRLHTEDTRESYEELKSLFFNRLKEVDTLLKLYALRQLINFSIRKNNQGEKNFNREVKGLYLFGLKQEILLENGKISSSLFQNVVEILSFLKDYEEASEFIEEYRENLHAREKADSLSLAKSTLLFWEGKYDDVISEVGQLVVKNLLVKVRIEVILIRCWFEKFLDNQIPEKMFNARVLAFKKAMKRAKNVPDSIITNCLSFASKMQLLMRVAKASTTQKEELKKRAFNDISKTKPLLGKAWLIEKLENM